MTEQSNIEKKYQKKNLREHILLRPDSYVGSVSKITEEIWVLKSGKFKLKPVTFSRALISIFDEILVNALDHSTKAPVKHIEITVDRKTGTIKIKNDGPGIEIVIHKEYNVYIPELIFGHLLTGSNYDDSEKRFTGGRNGYGAKCTNIYSTYFKVHTFDGKTDYIQEWRNNMTECGTPVIKSGKGKPFTEITFIPDLKRFQFKEITEDLKLLFEKRAYDACACTDKSVKITFNGEELKIKEFKRYIDLYIGPERSSTEETVKRIYLSKELKNGAIWELGVALNPDTDAKFQQVSFVNGICTRKGGKHVDYIVDQIIKKLLELIKKKKSTANITRGWLKDRLFIFLRTTIVNPKFTSQTKEELETPASEFHFDFPIDNKIIEKIGKLGIIDEALSFASYKETRELAKKTDGKKKNRIYGIPKLDDANLAGTKQSDKCTLFLVEGDSAKRLISTAISEVKHGRDYYGIYPLKGKILNIRTASQNQKITNKEIAEVKQILGLKQDKIYTSTSELRYGKVMFICDQDLDGTHIKGLGLNFFHTWWKELIQMNYIESFATPLIRATKGTKKIIKKEFYTIHEYEEWKANNDTKSYKIKYYKGLATNNNEDAKELFKDGIDNKKIIYQYDSKTDASLLLAFSGDQIDNRKIWLSKYNKNSVLTQDQKRPSIHEFVTKDLVHFSVYDNKRSIPSIVDGFKPSQRKILYGCFKRNLVEEIRVAQLAGYVSEHCGYHHGEMSLNQTIIGMAQDYVGSNNIPLLVPQGMFGSRDLGGKDAGQSRYIYTYMQDIVKKIFHPDDNALLDYLSDDDGNKIEPEYYVPIIPMILVNGTSGIGTGYSTDVACYNIKDIITNLLRLMENQEQIKMIPWYKNFRGTIVESETNPGVFIVTGKWQRVNDTKILITELPIGVWTSKYKEFLEELLGVKKDGKKEAKNKSKIVDLEEYKEHHTDVHVTFELEFLNKFALDTLIESGNLEKELKLIKTLSTNNMHLFDTESRIKKYQTPNDIISEFFDIRKIFYKKRYDYLINKYKLELDKISAKVKFIEDIIEGIIIVFRLPKKEIVFQLTDKKYPTFENSYDYLTNMPIHSFTIEKINELKNNKNEKQEMLDELLAKEPIDLWKEDLVELL